MLLAFAAAGIPMDRLAIILGALSVGIGFGLQSLINNLVSGLILAFEKPINVGDVVEFGGQSGTMKSIGFRSSIITTWDGADVIIPNGNLPERANDKLDKGKQQSSCGNRDKAIPRHQPGKNQKTWSGSFGRPIKGSWVTLHH